MKNNTKPDDIDASFGPSGALYLVTNAAPIH